MNATLILLVLGGGAALAIGAYLFMRSRRPEEHQYRHFLCPGCHHRLRYEARQAGHRGECSGCGHVLTFPPVSQSID